MTILDTNVVSEIMLSSPADRVLNWFARIRAADELFITTITVAEILYGIELLPAGKRRDSLKADAENMFAEDYAARILVFDEPSARSFAHIAGSRRRMGRPIAELDAQIAAIAEVNNATVATRNVVDFENCGIRVANPWVD